LISLARQFEMQVKMLQSADQNAARANQVLTLQ
ncbi:MAG: flagellar biosynthesis protein FlgF, partial [Candidatus Accumulibacter sp.]|nr:flagellar biosynthesis protein FlgF [Accumulibacter sp.]